MTHIPTLVGLPLQEQLAQGQSQLSPELGHAMGVTHSHLTRILVCLPNRETCSSEGQGRPWRSPIQGTGKQGLWPISSSSLVSMLIKLSTFSTGMPWSYKKHRSACFQVAGIPRVTETNFPPSHPMTLNIIQNPNLLPFLVPYFS